MKITVYAKPNAKKQGVEFLQIEPYVILSVKTKCPAQNGLANKDIIQQLAQLLQCKKTDIRIQTGHTSSKKMISVPFEPDQLLPLLKEKEIFLL